ncbi:hypothetical protein DL766_007092 [Monosporascus sp. MC13-8B]|nr:hypothetical protein DL766_007092 [Monosporascus sp. MC13-8B]
MTNTVNVAHVSTSCYLLIYVSARYPVPPRNIANSFLYESTGRNLFAVTGHISLEVGRAGSHSREDVQRRVEDAVRKGWAAPSYDHPTIASLVVQDPGTGKFSKIYGTSWTDPKRDQWLEDTVKVGDSHQLPALDGSEASNLNPPFRIAADVLPTPIEAQQRRLSDNAVQKAAAAEGDESLTILGILFKPGASLPGKHQRIALTLSKE